MSKFPSCFLGLTLFAGLPAVVLGGILPPPGPPGPVHTLVQQLEGDFSGLPEQDDPRFGFAVALHGDTLVVGAPGALVAAGDPPVIRERGVVFVYRRQPSGTWQLSQRLLYGAGGAGQCGHAVAVNEYSLLVGCPFHSDRGRAVFYTRSNPDAEFDDPVSFVDTSMQEGADCGSSVALIDADPEADSPLQMAAVGCPNRRDFPGGDSGLVGAVDIYRNFFTWDFATSINGPGTVATDYARSVSLNRAGPNPGKTLLLVVGIPGTTSGNGSVRIYANGDTVSDWSQEHMIVGPDAGSRFGYSVHMRGGRLAVGAPERHVLNPGLNPPLPVASGSLSITTRACTVQGVCTWVANVDEFPAAPLPIASLVAQNRLGHAVQVLTTDRVIAGAPWYPFGSLVGQARHFVLDDGEWVLNEEEPFYPAAPVPATSGFGSAISGDDTWMAIGAPGYPQENRGRVFLYAYDYDDVIFRDGFEAP